MPDTTTGPPSHLYRYGRFIGHHPRTVVVFWVVAVTLSFLASLGMLGTQSLFDRLHQGEPVVAGQAQSAREVLTEAGASTYSTESLLVEGVDLKDPQVARTAALAAKDLGAVTGVKSAVNPFVFPNGLRDPRAIAFVKDEDLDSRGFATVVTFEDLSSSQEAAARESVTARFDELTTDLDARASTRGGVSALVDGILAQLKTDLAVGEGIALPISFVVMVFVFGGFVAAGLPLAGALASIGGAFVALLGFSHVMDLDATVVNVVTILGLGLCIDYGLLVVSRFREELRGLVAGRPAVSITREEAVEAAARTVTTAGRTVFFSAVTVAVAMSGLLFFEADIVRALGAAGIAVVVVALLVAVSLIPALCVPAARRLMRTGTERASDEGAFATLSRWVHRRPLAVIVAVLAVLVTLALPSLHLSMTSSAERNLPQGAPERTFFETFSRDYAHLASPDIQVVTTAPLGEVRTWAAEAADLPGVTSVDPARVVGTRGAGADAEQVVVLGLRTGDGGLGADSRGLVSTLEESPPPFDAWVGGQASALNDFTDSVVRQAPLAVGTVILATFVLLFLMTGSVVIPIKALVMNVVSLGASLGAIVWIFQDGHLEGLLDFTSPGGVESFIPLLALAFGFGLSMDYEVFLLSRIVELHEQGYGNEESVTRGLQRSGRIITSAALLMVIVFAGFVFARVLPVKEIGVALVLAVVIDATLVRMLLVPATMAVLGDWNWWAPRWMRRAYARFGIAE